MSRVVIRGIAALAAATVLTGVTALLDVAPARAAVPTGLAGGARADVQRTPSLPRGAALGDELAAAASLHVTLALTPRDAAALAREAHAVSEPGSSEYHRYLSVAAFARRFGSSARSQATVSRTLRESGLAVSSVSANGLSLTASGTVGEIEGAFDTRLARVRLPDGNAAYADTATPTLPAAAAALVQGITGLDSLPASVPEGLRRARGAQAVSPEAHASCPAASGYGNGPLQIASAYGLNGLWDEGDLGAGTTVALYELEPYSASDVAAYQSCFGTHATVDDVSVNSGSTCARNDSSCGAEDELDIEDVAGLAPGVSIDVYEGPNTGSGAYDTWAAIVQADTAQVISTSWGVCESGQTRSALNEENTLFEEAASQGETVLAASGDSGAADCRTTARAVEDPASQPYVTGVGGTSLPDYQSPSTQTAWNNGEGAGGGGVSSVWAAPSWQTQSAANQYAVTCPTAPGSSTTTTNCRQVPDVSADADPETGYAVYYDGRWTEYGGTSAAAPTWAALVALADSSSYCAGAVGFANPRLYTLAPADFTDITSGNNSSATYDVSGYPAADGYDLTSGLGAPAGSTLVPALCGSNATVSEPSPAGATATGTSAAPPPAAAAPTVPADPVTDTTAPTTTTAPRPAGATVRIAGPYRDRATLGRHLRETVHAYDRLGLRLSYFADGLPKGLHLDHRTGTISGVPRRPGRSASSIIVTDAAGNSQSVVIHWMVGRTPAHR